MENQFKKFSDFVAEHTDSHVCECNCNSCKVEHDCKGCTCDPCDCKGCACH